MIRMMDLFSYRYRYRYGYDRKGLSLLLTKDKASTETYRKMESIDHMTTKFGPFGRVG